MASVQLNIAYNFKIIETRDVTVDDVQRIISNTTGYYDARSNILTTSVDFTNMEWYSNYLQANSIFATQHPDAYATYLLDLGYLPVVYLPSCLHEVLYQKMLRALSNSGIPFVQFKSSSFIQKYYNTTDMDAWVSKMDLAEILDMKPESIRSQDIVGRLFQYAK